MTPEQDPTPRAARTQRSENPAKSAIAAKRVRSPKPPPSTYDTGSNPQLRPRPRAAARDDQRARNLRKFRALASWTALGWLVLLYATSSDLRSGLSRVVALVYLLVVWFFLCRTKTLAWQSVAGLFALGLPWALGVGLFSRGLVRAVGAGGVHGLGPSTAMAGLVEQSLALLPLLVLLVLAPGRVKRFSVTDWLLLGFAAGLSFQAMQELLRLDGAHANYSLSPLSGGLAGTPLGAFPGQHVLTALTAVSIGLAIAAWRHSHRHTLSSIGRNAWRAFAVLAPLGAWWLSVSVQAGYNLAVTMRERSLSLADPSVPWPLRLGWRLGDHGFALGWMLLGLLLVALLVDAGSLRNAAEVADDPLPYPFAPTFTADAWAGRLTGWAGTRTALPVAAAVWLIAAGCAVVAYAVRDLVVVLVAHNLDRGHESRWTAIGRGRASGVLVRSIRADAISLAAGSASRVDRRVTRVLALTGLGIVLLGALVLGPHWAQPISDSVSGRTGKVFDAGPIVWLAGSLSAVGPWWSGLALWKSAAVVLGLLALMIVAAGPLDLPLRALGGWSLLIPRWPGSSPEPAGPLRSYLALSTPAELALDGVGAGLGLIPGNLVGNAEGSTTARDVRVAVQQFVADPGLFIARRRAAARQPAPDPAASGPGGPGTAIVRTGLPMRARPFSDLPPIKLADGRLLSPLTDDELRLFVSNLDELIRGDIRTRDEAADYQVRIYGDDKRLVSQRPETWSDGANIDYGMLGSAAYYNGRGSSWYAPETLPESIRHKAYLELDRRLIEFSTVVYYPASPFRALEITTNHPLVAQALEERMARLAIPGYVVLEP